jgi:hypothetical protein
MRLRAIASSLASIARRSARSSSLGHHNVRYLQRWRLTRQRKHLVHSDPGSDRCITQAGLANRFLHATGSKFSDVSQHRGETLFSLGYCDGFSRSDRADGMSGDPVKLGDLIHAGMRSANSRTIAR